MQIYFITFLVLSLDQSTEELHQLNVESFVLPLTDLREVVVIYQYCLHCVKLCIDVKKLNS